MSAPTDELIAAIYRDKLKQAERMTEEERFLAGPQLFDMACEWTKAGIRNQDPGLDEAGVMRVLRERLALRRRLEQATC